MADDEEIQIQKSRPPTQTCDNAGSITSNAPDMMMMRKSGSARWLLYWIFRIVEDRLVSVGKLLMMENTTWRFWEQKVFLFSVNIFVIGRWYGVVLDRKICWLNKGGHSYTLWLLFIIRKVEYILLKSAETGDRDLEVFFGLTSPH